MEQSRIIQNPGEALRKEYKKCNFVENEVYNVDVLFTTGEGKLRQLEMKPTIYRRTESAYKLKGLIQSRRRTTTRSRCTPAEWKIGTITKVNLVRDSKMYFTGDYRGLTS